MNKEKLKTYEALFMRYFPKVKYFITHFVKSTSIAEELAQDVFIKVWINFEKIRYIEHQDAYIYRMARNIAFDYLSYKYKEELIISNLNPEKEYTIEEDIYTKELELLIELTVSRMPPQRKKVYEMSRTEGCSNDEIARQLNISKKTVENHLNAALKQIRKVISVFIYFYL